MIYGSIPPPLNYIVIPNVNSAPSQHGQVNTATRTQTRVTQKHFTFSLFTLDLGHGDILLFQRFSSSCFIVPRVILMFVDCLAGSVQLWVVCGPLKLSCLANHTDGRRRRWGKCPTGGHFRKVGPKLHLPIKRGVKKRTLCACHQENSRVLLFIVRERVDDGD